MRDSTIIYRSFYEAIIGLPKENQAEVWEAIFEYSLNFKTIELIGISKTIFTLIKPQLDANIKRYQNGLIPKTKQEVSELEANNKQEVSIQEANENKNDNPNPNKNGNKNVNIEFDVFWNLYNKKIGGKEKCQKKWLKLSDEERQKIIDSLPNWLKQFKDKQFQPHAETYLNNNRWDDEIIQVVSINSAIKINPATGKPHPTY